MTCSPTIIVTNDDGIYSEGLIILCEAVRDLGKTIVVAPETPKSASGLGLTLHKPIRLQKMRFGGVEMYSINGTPSDVVHVALNILCDKADLVVSGVNLGDNTSVQTILSSGTIGAAAQAALLGIPAAAFSAMTVDTGSLTSDKQSLELMKRVIRIVSKHLLEKGLPEGVDLVSVNFPERITRNTVVKIVPPARLRFREAVEKRVDPHGREYYWLYGEPVEPEEGTDVYVVLKEKNIALTPLTLNLSPPSPTRAVESLLPLVDELNTSIRG